MTLQLPQWESLSLAEQVAQMIVVRASGHLFDHQIQYPAWEPPADLLRHYLQDLAVGGVILLGGSAAEVGLRSHQLQDWAKLPLFVAADIEEGVGQRFSGATWFPPPMALGAIAQSDLQKAQAYAEQMGEVTAQEALAVGINWILAPVVDVNNNPQNPVINVRAFGETAETVGQLTVAFLKGTQKFPVLTAAKHFPGHGDTATDSHLELPVLSHAKERLEKIEFPPFKATIAAGVDAVMSAHLKILAFDSKFPATLSYQVLTQQLRQRLSFDGLIVTDALIMGAIANQYGVDESAVLAVEAGADILLMPADPERAILAVCQAVETGRITPARIQASLARIWRAKHKICSNSVSAGDNSHAWEQISPFPLQLDHLSKPTAQETVLQILQDSGQSKVDNPLPTVSSARNLIMVDDVLTCGFLTRSSPAIALPARFGYQLQLLDRNSVATPLDLNTEIPRPTLLQIFIRGNPFRGSAALTQAAKDWFQALLTSRDLKALAIYGSPYVLEQFLPELPSEVPYVFSFGQMPAAQAIALKTLFDPSHIQTQEATLSRQFTT